ncbi:hypothetical protein M6B38_386115 [Iris pallida]|uniref:Uncharacterized protein n=1 Tax=Iris pallida TaxID=29817 RepID=A0AAX6G304_IRIPA|nr:hypothetical protein M6B38_177530 [Iris pallida]KAJ6822965.1 hypothetical protein M6B38_385985 [Iris pallida]KAJ6823069.1 hypothetical protein M6B38_386115 [Iris pallida]
MPVTSNRSHRQHWGVTWRHNEFVRSTFSGIGLCFLAL